MAMLSEDSVRRCCSAGNFPRTASLLSLNEDTSSIISYKDIISALKESLNREYKFEGAFSTFQDRAAGHSRNKPSISISSVQYDTDTDTFQSDYSEGTYGSRSQSPPTSISSDSDFEDDSKVISFPLASLLEQGTESPAGKHLVPLSHSRVSAFKDTLAQERRPSRRRDAHPELESFLDLSSTTDFDNNSEADSDSQGLDHLIYSPKQTALFGDFLYAPFASTAPSPSSSSSSSSSLNIGPGPLDADVHDYWRCECQMCEMADIAMTREFSEVHPYVTYDWINYYDSEDEGDE